MGREWERWVWPSCFNPRVVSTSEGTVFNSRRINPNPSFQLEFEIGSRFKRGEKTMPIFRIMNITSVGLGSVFDRDKT
jgi:hypothetical protein